MLIRQPSFSGIFYPDDPKVLKGMIDDFLRQASVPKLKNKPRALIVPHAGYIYSGPIAAYGYKAISFFDYKKIILLGPSHNFSFSGIVSSPFSKWLTPLRETECLTLKDFPFLEENKFIQESSEIHELEHSLEVELPFLQTIFKDFIIFPLIAGDLEAEEGKKILASILDEESLLVVSSDLSHYLPFNEALKQDKVTLDAILDLDLERFLDYGEACGKIPISFLISLAKEKNWLPKLLKAANSGETQGGKDQVVGYASVVFI